MAEPLIVPARVLSGSAPVQARMTERSGISLAYEMLRFLRGRLTCAWYR